MKPQEPIPHNYRMETLNKIFAFSALALLLVTAVTVLYDYSRGWKKFQLEFQRIQAERVRGELTAAEKAQSRAELARLDKEVKVAEQEIAANRREYRDAQRLVDDWEGKFYAADQNYRFSKATLDALRYDAEIAKQQKRPGWQSKVKEYEELTARVNDLKINLEDVTRKQAAVQSRMARFTGKIDDIQDRRKELNATIDRLRKQLESVETANAQFLILNSPLLDFVSPTLKIDQIVVADSYVNLNFMSMPRVDRCTTCHRAVDRQGFESKKEAGRLIAELEGKLGRWEYSKDKVEEVRARIGELKEIQAAKKDLPNPFRTHPYIETYAGSSSPHPMQDFGCTSCHRGEGRSTDFARAGHTPYSHKQQERWEHDLDWEPQPYLETPMHPRHFQESACVKCHSSQMEVARGEKINKGFAMVELYGCYSCHKIDNWRFANLRKPGPDLNGIAEKTTPEWVHRWLSDPAHFRSTTRMPSFFYQRNMVGPAVDKQEAAANRAKQNVEIQALTAFLFAKSTNRQWSPGPSGDAARGLQLVRTVGCLGCHVTEEGFIDEKTKQMRLATREDFPLERHFGFNLVGTGSKTNPQWLFHWLKDPRNYYADAPMPDLRLTDQEAGDITAWLMTKQKPRFMQGAIPAVDPAALSELTKSYLLNTMSIRDADAKAVSMSQQQQLVYLGERTIEKYGCYSCHNIKGFENAKPIGTELTVEGSKNLHLFDFGFAHDYVAHDGKKEHIQHNISSWIYSKLRSPRVFDDQRQKAYHDKLKMPNFRLTRNETRQIASVVLGLTKEKVNDNRMAGRDSRVRMVEEGRKRVSQNNCRGCHVVDGQGRAIASTIADDAMWPPDLGPEGNRVQSPWLFEFLKDPTVTPIRPWLGVRMPTFHFSDEETNTIVSYFAADGKVPQFDTMRRNDPAARNVAVGQTFFEMLRCAQCHPTGGVQTAANTANLAPNLEYARVRLRHEWIPDWIRRPSEMIPGTKMPTNFPRDGESGEFTSPLLLAIDSPQFAAYKSRLMQQFATEQEMRAVLGDVVQTTNYLRDYIWTLGPSEMRISRPATPERFVPNPAPQPQLPAMRSSRAGSNGPVSGSR